MEIRANPENPAPRDKLFHMLTERPFYLPDTERITVDGYVVTVIAEERVLSEDKTSKTLQLRDLHSGP